MNTRYLTDIDAQLIFQSINPKRPGTASYERYEKYKQATSVKNFLNLGGTLADLRFDHSRGYLNIPIYLVQDEVNNDPVSTTTDTNPLPPPISSVAAIIQPMTIDQNHTVPEIIEQNPATKDDIFTKKDSNLRVDDTNDLQSSSIQDPLSEHSFSVSAAPVRTSYPLDSYTI
mmetsp:Transcript_7548/g.11310  ORF Transcript_7548/g.11310 Transcript_7548/m.11310 type:complete len:172 (+) Transcript_7548:3175-3690(+)